MRSLHFTQTTDSRFTDECLEKLLMSNVEKIKANLSKLDVSVTTSPIRKLTFTDAEGGEQRRIDFIVTKNHKGVKWNDIYSAVGSVKAVPYDLK